MPNPLDRFSPTRKCGAEPLHSSGTPVDGSVLDFWRWSTSDLMSNATRGRFAEYLVHRAVGGADDAVRDEWDAFDLTTAVAKRQANVYVFALLHERTILDPLDVAHWTFFVLPTKTLDARIRCQHSITLASLIREDGEGVPYERLHDAIKTAGVVV